MAAHLYDGLQDRDEPEPWWLDLGAGAAINIASGLVLSGLSVISGLHRHPKFHPLADEIGARFYKMGFKMSSGQHLDLVSDRPSVELWFEIAEAKSGSFFGLACWSGARLATGNTERLDGFFSFGSHLGVLLQIYDDLDDLGELKKGNLRASPAGITRSLPFVYALGFCSEEKKECLLESLGGAYENQLAARDLFNQLDSYGAALFLHVEIERRKELVRRALEVAGPGLTARNELASLLDQFKPKNNPV
jgi:geranylgeranyl pyrophosphate synthase